jgi:putative ATP-dependent endonuclease of the OLD family
MGQVIVTSHSPYIIEKFDPGHVVVLTRDDAGKLASTTVVLPLDFKLRRYRENRRQFAEAVLARAVLVVEGATEAAVFPAVADVLDQDGTLDYLHPDLAGISVFDAGNDVSVPLYAPVFASMGKPVFGIHDRPNETFGPDIAAKTASFTHYEVITYAGIEELLVTEIPVTVQRRFAASVASRLDYPTHCGYLTDMANDDAVRAHVQKLLQARKGLTGGYAPLLVAECASKAELPRSLADFLIQIDSDLRSPVIASDQSADTDTEPRGA